MIPATCYDIFKGTFNTTVNVGEVIPSELIKSQVAREVNACVRILDTASAVPTLLVFVIWNSFHRKVLEKLLKRPPLFVCLTQQALTHGSSDISFAHSVASRYGRMILSTRQMRAIAHESPKVCLFPQFLESPQSFNGESRPILLRYLKQSATVFAAE